jgi:aminomuconate-semialdehyde/2-hydroxymuconate-6-semialdehyde dehydrogenase
MPNQLLVTSTELLKKYGLEPVNIVAAAEKAFPIWSQLSIEKRSDILVKLSEGIQNHMDEFVQAESRDNGKPVSLAAHVDIPRAVSNFHFFATAILHFASESHYMEGVGVNYTTRKPIGISFRPYQLNIRR